VGAKKLTTDVSFNYRVEAATQSDYGASTLRYTAHYTIIEGGLAVTSAGVTVGCEVLGADHNVGFKTPLATLHAFNGWADLFLNTPAGGLRDTYLRGTANLPGTISLIAFYHQFDSAAGRVDFGHEFDLQLSRKFGARITVLVKCADFRHASPGYPSVRKFWAQTEFAF
jgi:hypothetical protein